MGEMNWKEEIKSRIDKINKITSVISEVLKELESDQKIKASVQVNLKDDQLVWNIKIDKFEKEFKCPDFDFDLKMNGDQIDEDRFGKPIFEQRDASLNEIIINALLSKFKFIQ